MTRLKNEVAIITGGAGDIGCAHVTMKDSKQSIDTTSIQSCDLSNSQEVTSKQKQETKQKTITSSAISLMSNVDMPNGYLIKTPCIGSYSAIFLTGPGGGSVLLPIVLIIYLFSHSSAVKPIGNSSELLLDSVNEKKSNAIVTLNIKSPPFYIQN